MWRPNITIQHNLAPSHQGPIQCRDNILSVLEMQLWKYDGGDTWLHGEISYTCDDTFI